MDQLRRLLDGDPNSNTLTMEDCVLNDRMIALMAERLGPVNQLHSLVFRRCRQLNMTTLMAIVSLLNGCTLVSLEISSCYLARQAGILLGQSLPQCSVLQRVDLSGNNLRDGGVKAIADGLRLAKIDTLSELNVSNNGVTTVGFSTLASVPVQRLLLGDNSITTLPSSFEFHPHLQVLDLSGNAISAEARRELWWLVLQPSRHRLTELNIQRCGVSVASEAQMLQTFLHKVKTTPKHERICGELRHVHVGENVLVVDSSGRDEEQEDPPPSPNAGQDELFPSTPDRFAELKRVMETHVAGLRVHILSVSAMTKPQPFIDSDTVYEAEPETPGRHVRRELLERTEFMRRHSEELPLSDDQSLASLVSDKLLTMAPPRIALKPSLSSQPRLPPPEMDTVVDSAAASPLPRRASSCVHPGLASTPSSSFFVATASHHNPSLDDVASQFSLDPPPSMMTSAMQHTDVEFIVARTIDTMNRSFEQRLAQFLRKMEFQQQEKRQNASHLQTLAAKVEACERAIPRLEARLDVLADRIAISSAQANKLQLEPQAKADAVSMHLTQFKHEFDANQSAVLRNFTENMVKDGLRVDDRMQQLEGKVAHLEGIIQAEQHASLLALEAISEAFAGGGPAVCAHTSQMLR